MKKFAAVCCVLLVALTMSACQAFHDDKTQTYPADEPLTMAIFLQVNDAANFSPADLSDWLVAVRTNGGDTTDANAPRITAAEQRKTTVDSNTYTVDLTLTNVPATTIRKQVTPFKITYTQTVYNPLALLPPSTVFTYVIGYTTTNRHSAVNTDWVVTNADGSYTYLWTTGEPIQFVKVYPNRPLYYGLVLTGAVAMGVVVYLVARYNDCKKHKKQL